MVEFSGGCFVAFVARASPLCLVPNSSTKQDKQIHHLKTQNNKTKQNKTFLSAGPWKSRQVPTCFSHRHWPVPGKITFNELRELQGPLLPHLFPLMSHYPRDDLYNVSNVHCNLISVYPSLSFLIISYPVLCVPQPILPSGLPRNPCFHREAVLALPLSPTCPSSHCLCIISWNPDVSPGVLSQICVTSVWSTCYMT